MFNLSKINLYKIVALLFFSLLFKTSLAQNITPNSDTSVCGSMVLSAPNSATYEWKQSLNNGVTWTTIAGATSKNYTVTQTGLYTVITTPATSDTVSITVNPFPDVNFTFSPNNNCSNVPVNFTNTTTVPSTFVWNFGDGNSTNNTATTTNTSHTFIGTTGTATQSFTVKLVATSSAGCKDSTSKTVTTKQLPHIKLAGSNESIYNGQTYFRECSSGGSASLTFMNQTNTVNTNYKIVWGDGSPDFVNTNFASPINHSFPLGTSTIYFIVSNSNCTDTATYYAFIGSNPAVGFVNPGNSTICTNTSLTFPISSTATNSQGTTYTVVFNDGTSPITFSHPPPADVTHLFTTTSCGITSGSYSNSFSATITASNPCLTSTASVVPIYVSKKPNAAYTISPKDTVCVNSNVTFTNTSGNNSYINAPNCSEGKLVWEVTPSTGWSISNGSLGDIFNSNDPSFWATGTAILKLNFTTAGTYSIKLKIGNPICGMDSIIKTICVNPLPTASFNVNNTIGCAPFNVTANGTTNVSNCVPNTFVWSTTYTPTAGCLPNTSSVSYVGGTDASSQNPQLQFNNPGVYTIKLYTVAAANACSSPTVSQQITVKGKPTVSAINASDVCQNGSTSPTVTVGNCNASGSPTYSWSFVGGSPSSSSQANPGNITYTSSGTPTIALDVTNECGTTSTTKNINVTAAPNVVVPSNKIFCAGENTGQLGFSSNVSTASYNWTNSNTAIGLNASGTASSASPYINGFIAKNNTSLPITATITVTPVSGCSGIPQTFTITVNPKPLPPVVVSSVDYCINQVANALTASASAGNSLTWFDNPGLLNGTTTPPTPSTSITGTTHYFVIQENSYNCKSSAAQISVSVVPAISNNTIGNNQTICAGATPNTLVQTSTTSGGTGSYNYQWQQSTDGGITWTIISGANSSSYLPSGITLSTQFRRIVLSACTDTSNIVTISILGVLNNTNVSSSQVICEGNTPTLLDGETPTGGNGTFSFIWEQSLNNVTWSTVSGVTTEDFQPNALNTTTYFRRKTISGNCETYSTAVKITVNPKPVMQPKANLVLCNNVNTSIITFTSIPNSNVTYTWQNNNTNIGLAANGIGNIASFTSTNNSNPKIPLDATISVVPTYTFSSVSCLGDTATFNISVLPSISVAAIADTTICSGASIPIKNLVNDAGSFAGTSITYQHTVTGSGTNLSSGSGNFIPAFTASNTGNTNVTTTISVKPIYTYKGKSCDGNIEVYSYTITPSTPGAAAGNDTLLCSSSSFTMNAILVGGSTGVWSQFGGNATTIQNPISPTTQIAGLLPNNTYSYIWNVTGVASCPGTTDTITIINYGSIVNQIDNNSKIICATQSVTVTGTLPTGGNGVYNYQWQQSTDGGVTWTNIPLQTNKDLFFIPTTSVLVKRIVYSLPCIETSTTTSITVQPAISNNVISANQNICINTTPSTLIGSTATGGDGNISYQWQQSTNGGVTWTNITGATLKDYSPGLLTTTTRFRRVVSTNLCFGAQGNNSAMITIKVNPDAHANFTATVNTGCAPFLLNSIIIKPTILPLQNNSYHWFANNIAIGTGASFPGYTINLPGDSVTIKLVTLSPFGCKADSITQKFYTVAKPQTSFTVSDTAGCGPLNVAFTNTTPNVNLFNYNWNFGNGLTSNLAQPNNVTFATNPTYFDTIYTIQLSATTVCETVKDTQYIKVKSKPKAIFTPNKSIGCSPMTVVFNNTSRGNNVHYIWNFGDGGPDTAVNSKAAQTYTYYRGFQDTVDVKLIAINECGSDTLFYKVVISPNQINLDFAINGNQTQGCKPNTIKFINASNGATSFFWNFGDGNTLSTTKNIDTITHTYTQAGTFMATLKASNNCSDTTSTETIIIFNSPVTNFTSIPTSVCIGDTIHFTNQTDTATSYLWKFNDNTTSTLIHPKHIYTNAGNYFVQLKAYRQYNSGITCIDSVTKPINVVLKQQGSFTASDTISPCVPFSVTLSNNAPALQTIWYSNNIPIDTANTITYTFNQVGNYVIKMNAVNAGGCIKEDTQTIIVKGPVGTWQYDHGIFCNNIPIRFEVFSSNIDSVKFNFGDGNFITTTNKVVYHTYNQSGNYLPSAQLFSNFSSSCTITLQGTDTIKIDALKAGYKYQAQAFCDSTRITFTDTSRYALPIVSWQWNFGDGNTSLMQHPKHTYSTTNIWTVRLITQSLGGCIDTATYNINVKVNNKPNNSIIAPSVGCTYKEINYLAQNISTDSISFNNWNFSNGINKTGSSVNHIYPSPGNYQATLISGTTYGCTDTSIHTITIHPSPQVSVSPNQTICKGNSLILNATGANTYSWTPINNTLSCLSCPNPTASPITTTMYIVEGTNNFNCSNKDSVLITVAQPIILQVSPNDTICIGQSSQLSVSGAYSYQWSPNTSLQNSNTANPLATPVLTTKYRVIGFDNYNCFQDTAFVTVAVGKYPTIKLEDDKVLPTGTQLALNSSVTNGPIVTWIWTPSADLNCNNCPLPVATIKNNVCYTVTASNMYHCKASDTICIKTFCEGTQVFIPNAFTPDGDGINDVLMVRGTGIKTVRSFRIFNRWGQIVFEKTNVTPNDPSQGWDGKINGNPASPEVYVYTCEVVCENGVSYTYKGNIAILK